VTATAGNKLTVILIDALPTGLSLSDLKVVTRPRSTDGQRIVHLIDPVVEDFVTQTLKKAFPRSVSPDPGQAAMPPTIPHFTFPTPPFDTVGLYEGGNGYRTGVIRSGGRCKMRAGALYTAVRAPALSQFTEVWPFCFVCRFVIVD